MSRSQPDVFSAVLQPYNSAAVQNVRANSQDSQQKAGGEYIMQHHAYVTSALLAQAESLTDRLRTLLLPDQDKMDVDINPSEGAQADTASGREPRQKSTSLTAEERKMVHSLWFVQEGQPQAYKVTETHDTRTLFRFISEMDANDRRAVTALQDLGLMNSQRRLVRSLSTSEKARPESSSRRRQSHSSTQR